mmetsp:Transcript_48723/g.110351  ORF Transcript_48723/g.110351 Transcript_48723/m.110351 type:complete len:197 (-) Transcript_48723:270-860(-)
MEPVLSGMRHAGFALQRFAARGASFVQRHPVASVSAGGCITGALGDALAQRASNEPFDVRRWLGMISFCVFDSTVLYLPFYRFLDSRFGPGVTVRSVLAKTVADDAVFVPCVELPLFFTWTSACEGDSILRRLRSEYGDTVMAGWLFNVPITIVNFALVPPAFRVIFGDAAELAWSTLMSYLSHRTRKQACLEAAC